MHGACSMPESNAPASDPSEDEVASGEQETGMGDSLLGTLMYSVTLPERTARSASALVGGLVNESAARLIPAVFRSSRSYSTFVGQALDMMVHDVGGVAKADPESDNEDQDAKLAQKAVGGLLDVAGAATLHLSPMTVLAVFSDIAYGSGVYLKKLSEELKREGVIAEDSSIDHVSDLIDALQQTSVKAADALDTPPINVAGITETVSQLRDEISKADPRKLIPQSEIARMWSEMEDVADQANVGLWDVSTTMTMYAMNRVSVTTRGALSTVSVAGSLMDEHIVRHYAGALTEIRQRGFYATLSESSAPYLEAVWQNFDGDRETLTEELLSGRLIGKAWTSVRGWFAPAAPTEEKASTESD